jgi:hypothetical protein
MPDIRGPDGLVGLLCRLFGPILPGLVREIGLAEGLGMNDRACPIASPDTTGESVRI